jgi:hypothetical protein
MYGRSALLRKRKAPQPGSGAERANGMKTQKANRRNTQHATRNTQHATCATHRSFSPRTHATYVAVVLHSVFAGRLSGVSGE